MTTDSTHFRVVVVLTMCVLSVLGLGLHRWAGHERDQQGAEGLVEDAIVRLEWIDAARVHAGTGAALAGLAEQYVEVGGRRQEHARVSPDSYERFERTRAAVLDGLAAAAQRRLTAYEDATFADRMLAAEAWWSVADSATVERHGTDVARAILHDAADRLGPGSTFLDLSFARRVLALMTGRLEGGIADEHRIMLGAVALRSTHVQNLLPLPPANRAALRTARRQYAGRMVDAFGAAGLPAVAELAGEGLESLVVRAADDRTADRVARLLSGRTVREHLIDLGFATVRLPGAATPTPIAEIGELTPEGADSVATESLGVRP